jgi:hypothetical protein
MIDFSGRSAIVWASKREELTHMKMTTDTRYPLKRMEVNMPEYGEYLMAVHPTKRIIIENRGAAPGAKIIILMRPDA